MNRTTDMTTGNPTRHILTFALPLIVTNLGQQLYMIVDASIVGRGVGVKALAAVGATDWCYWLILWTVTGLTQGFSTFISRCFGDHDFRGMNKTIAMSVLLCAVIGAVLTAAGLAAAEPMLQLLRTPADIIADAVRYLRTMVAGTLVVMAYNMAASILRAVGDGRTPLYAMVISALLNIGLDVLFVFAFGWGVFGAALASVLSQMVSFLYCLWVIFRMECITLNRKSFLPNLPLLRGMTAFGIPIALQYIVIALGGIIAQSSINMQGSMFVAGYTATNKLYGLLESSAISLGIACSTFLAQNYGAGNYARFRQGVRSAVLIVLAMAAAVTGFALLLRKHLLRLFLDVSEAGGTQAMEIGIRYLTIMASCLCILYLIHVFKNALQAMAIAKWSMISGLLECVVRIFMAKVALLWMGSDALFLAEPAAWFSALIPVILAYYCYQRKFPGGSS